MLGFEINETLGNHLLNIFFLQFFPHIDSYNENLFMKLHYIITNKRNVCSTVLHVCVTHSRLNWTLWLS